MKQLHFYAVDDDLPSVLRAIEAIEPLQYVLTGNFLDEPRERYDTVAALPRVGIADRETGSVCRSYLVAPKSASIQHRTTTATDGRTRTLIDQLVNHDTVVVRPAGRWRDDLVLAGNISTAWPTDVSASLMKQCASAMRKSFTKVNTYFVGPAAMKALQSGQRLTISAQSPKDFDLVV